MIVLETADAMRAWSRQCRASGLRVGFVPTMGYLHRGHLSLVEEARRRADRVVVSVYVNPTQFAPGEDFSTYPRDNHGDLDKLRGVGCDAAFVPPDLYHSRDPHERPHETFVEVTELQRPLCGVNRPTFFRGVATIVTKLFNIVEPDLALFGKKDYQQWRLITRMVRDLHFPVEIVGMPIAREADGLAMSSRNARLLPHHRRQAPAIFRALTEASAQVRQGVVDTAPLIARIRERIENTGGAIDYVTIVGTQDLKPLDRLDRPAVAAVAVRYGEVRLIDNLEIVPKN